MITEGCSSQSSYTVPCQPLRYHFRNQSYRPYKKQVEKCEPFQVATTDATVTKQSLKSTVSSIYYFCVLQKKESLYASSIKEQQTLFMEHNNDVIQENSILQQTILKWKCQKDEPSKTV